MIATVEIWREKTAVKILQSRTYAVVPTRISSSRRYKYLVKSEHPVDTFLLVDEELSKFDNREKVESFGGFDKRRMHKESGKLPCDGKWNLVISNTSREPTAVCYEVS